MKTPLGLGYMRDVVKAESGLRRWRKAQPSFLLPSKATLELTRQGLKKGSNWVPVKSILLNRCALY